MKQIRVSIVGRPNVGKSTLFNRLLGHRRALVHDRPGVTRDRLEIQTTWNFQREPIEMTLTDTGGVGGEILSEEVDRQVELAIATSDLVLMVFDGQIGWHPHDREVLRGIQKHLPKKIPVIGIVNKIDLQQHEEQLHDFYQAGLESLLPVSAEHDRGIYELRREIVRHATEGEARTAEPKLPQIAIVGKPNVGKSTLLNALLKKNRQITSPMAGTTVDAVDSKIRLGENDYLFIDTAGIRKKSQTQQGIEVLSVIQAKKALDRADVAILVLDGEVGITDQDEKISGLIEQAGCSVILMINKWDTQRHNEDFSRNDAAEALRARMRHLHYAPVTFVSALEGRGFKGLDDLIQNILTEKRTKLSTKELTELVRRETQVHNPRQAKFFMVHQSGRYPPTFVCHVNDPKKVDFSLQRHLSNSFRREWGFMGTPIRVKFTKREKDHFHTRS